MKPDEPSALIIFMFVIAGTLIIGLVFFLIYVITLFERQAKREDLVDAKDDKGSKDDMRGGRTPRSPLQKRGDDKGGKSGS